MAQAQAVDHAARAGIVDRGFLAQEVGNDCDAIGPGRYLPGDFVHVLMKAKACGLRCLTIAGSQRVDEPIQRRSAGGHAAIRHEETGDQVVVEEHARVRYGPLRRNEDVDYVGCMRDWLIAQT